MAANTSNDKSRQISIRIPHDVLEEIEATKADGESTAGFLVAAARNEITRRQHKGSDDNLLLSSLNALARIEEIGVKAGEDIQQLVSVARTELQRRAPKSDAAED